MRLFHLQQAERAQHLANTLSQDEGGPSVTSVTD